MGPGWGPIRGPTDRGEIIEKRSHPPSLASPVLQGRGFLRASRLGAGLVICLLIWGGGFLSPPAVRAQTATDELFFQTTLSTPALRLLPDPEIRGSRRALLEGYGTLDRPGAPAVPVRIYRIAIPEGSTPRLEVVRAHFRPLPHLFLSPVPTTRRDPTPGPFAEEGTVPLRARKRIWRDPDLFGRDAEYPGEVVRLGTQGRLRDQHYVELIYTPLLVNPVSGRSRLAEEVEIRITFEGASPSRGPHATSRKQGPLESLYYGGLLNEGQGRRFRQEGRRLVAGTAPEVAPPAAASGGTVYKIAISRDGIYRVDSASVPDLLGLDPTTFRLRSRDVEIPMRVVDSSPTGDFGAGDVLEFYGQELNEPFAILNCDVPTCLAPIHQYNDVTDVNVYLLDSLTPAGRLRMGTLDGTPGGLTPEPDHVDVAHWEVNDRFFPLGEADPFYSIPTLTADTVNPASRDIQVDLPGLNSATFVSNVLVRMRGVSDDPQLDPDHRTEITVNGNATTTDISDWDGQVIFDQSTTADQSLLTDPTTLHLEVPVVSGTPLNQVIADFVEISYRRDFLAVAESLDFDFPNQAAKFSVGGFVGGPVLAYDLSRLVPGSAQLIDPRLLINGTEMAGTLTFEVGVDASVSSRRFLALGPGAIQTPDSVGVLAPSTLLDTTNEADYLIVAHSSLLNETPGGPFDLFVTYLETTRGFTVKTVDIEEIYDQFNNSILHPEAIRSFLSYAHTNWVGMSGTAPPPSYVLFLGDAVWDFKNTLDRSDWVNLVPTPIMFVNQAILQYHAADNWLASFLGDDQSADILFARIPVRTASQADTVFSKILDYAQAPPTGAWRSEGYFLADVGNDVQETAKFELVANNAASFFQSPWTQTKQYYAQPPYNAPTGGGADPTQYKADFVSHWNSATPAIAAFDGHGAFSILGNDIWFDSVDVPLLTNMSGGAYLPFFFNSDCLSGGFHAVGVDSLAEVFLSSPTGGAIGFFSPASLSFTFIGNVVSNQLFSDLFSPQKLRELGPLTWRARDVLYQQGSIVDMQGYTLVGDPSLALVLPAPRPPTSFAVMAGNGQVDLSWTPSVDPEAVGVNIYRTEYTSQPYTKVNGAPLAGSSFIDTTVTNGTTYFYRAVSADAGGFEGAVTNLNDDCSPDGLSDGPECRRSTPQNLAPPGVPQGVSVRDPGSGASLEISWLPNPEGDIERYWVAYGLVSGSHPNRVDAGTGTTLLLQGLTEDVTYYLVVSAENTSGVEGPESVEVTGTPRVFQGIAPPATVQDLTLDRAGDDLILSWGEISTDIYGNPTVIDHYDVYMGGSPDFLPDTASNRIAMVPAGPNPGYTHVGGAPLADGYYLVSAVDEQGCPSGLGNDLPAGISTLSVVPSETAGMLLLSWDAVTSTVTGGAATISHYTLYASDTVLPRHLLGPSSLLLDGLTGVSVEVPVPPDPLYFYSLIAVDPRGNLSPY